MQARSNRALVAIRRFMMDREDSHGACRDQELGTGHHTPILEPVGIAPSYRTCIGMEAPPLASVHRGFGSKSDLAARNALSALLACQMVFDVIGDLVADRRQLKQLVLHERIVGLFGKFPIHGRLAP